MSRLSELVGLWNRQQLRILTGLLIILAICSTALVIQKLETEKSVIGAKDQLSTAQYQSFLKAVNDLEALTAKIASYKAEGVTTNSVEDQLSAIKTELFTNQSPLRAIELIEQATSQLEQLREQKLASDRQAAELAARQGIISGIVSQDAQPLSSVTVSLLSGSSQTAKTITNASGQFSLSASEGKYTLTASRSGYATYKKFNVEIKAGQTASLDISLTKAVTAPATSGGDSTGNSSYERKTVQTSNGSFLVDIISLNLASGSIKVYTETANDDDCSDNCPTKSLASHVSQDSGFAGINGTYFCPSDYSSCAGKVNTFFWKIKNSRLGKMINASNGLGENEAFLTFNSSGSPTYYSAWKSAPGSVFAGINSGPRLIEGGKKVLTDGSMDDKQRTVKSNRGALGVKGQTLYAIVAKSATVPDTASVLEALGVDYALNLDGGGSSALYYKGSYKVGPGRSLPNAVVFVGG